MLRQEVYALDGTRQEPHPYTVTEQNFTIELLQPQGGNRHARVLHPPPRSDQLSTTSATRPTRASATR